MDHVYQVRIYWIEDGKRKSKSKSGFKTKREAQIYAAELEILKARTLFLKIPRHPSLNISEPGLKLIRNHLFLNVRN